MHLFSCYLDFIFSYHVSTFKVTMEATHKFMIPVGKQSNGTLVAIYHSSVPSWGVLGNALYGMLCFSYL
jgi:hypothetical protein